MCVCFISSNSLKIINIYLNMSGKIMCKKFNFNISTFVCFII